MNNFRRVRARSFWNRWKGHRKRCREEASCKIKNIIKSSGPGHSDLSNFKIGQPGLRFWDTGCPSHKGHRKILIKSLLLKLKQSMSVPLFRNIFGGFDRKTVWLGTRIIQNRSMTHLKTFFFGSFLGIFSMPFSSNGICPDLLTQTTTPKPWLIHHLINEPEKPSENTYKLWFCLQNSVLSLMCKKL